MYLFDACAFSVMSRKYAKSMLRMFIPVFFSNSCNILDLII